MAYALISGRAHHQQRRTAAQALSTDDDASISLSRIKKEALPIAPQQPLCHFKLQQGRHRRRSPVYQPDTVMQPGLHHESARVVGAGAALLLHAIADQRDALLGGPDVPTTDMHHLLPRHPTPAQAPVHPASSSSRHRAMGAAGLSSPAAMQNAAVAASCGSQVLQVRRSACCVIPCLATLTGEFASTAPLH